MSRINKAHRYLIKENATGGYVGSTDNLGARLPFGFSLMDTLGEDGLGTVKGNRGIPAFLKAKSQGIRP